MADADADADTNANANANAESPVACPIDLGDSGIAAAALGVLLVGAILASDR